MEQLRQVNNCLDRLILWGVEDRLLLARREIQELIDHVKHDGGSQRKFSPQFVHDRFYTIHEQMTQVMFFFFPQNCKDMYNDLTNRTRQFLETFSIIPKTGSLITHLQADKSSSEWFCFGKNSEINVERIIQSCFSNPDRLTLPYDGPEDTCVDSSHSKPDYFIDRIYSEMPNALQKMDARRIRLFDTSKFWKQSKDGRDVDKKVYCRDMRECDWYGPYKENEDDSFFFYSFNRDASNIYGIRLWLWFSEKSIVLSYDNQFSNIAPDQDFGNELEEGEEGEKEGEE